MRAAIVLALSAFAVLLLSDYFISTAAVRSPKVDLSGPGLDCCLIPANRGLYGRQ